MNDNELLNSSLTAAAGISDSYTLPVSDNLSSSISTALGGITSTNTYTYPYGNYVCSEDTISSIKIAGDYVEKEVLKKEKEDILDSVQDYCKNYCFQGCEGICDGDTKAQCPLWNRLKCEKRV